MALAQQSSGLLVPDAGGGASRTQAAQVSGLVAGAGPAWRRLPRGQAGPSPGGLGPGTLGGIPHSPERCLQDASTKLKTRVRDSGEKRRGDARAPERRTQPRRPPPVAEGFRLTLKSTRIPLVAFPSCAGRAPSFPSPCLRCPRRRRGLGRDGWLERPAGAAPPLPRATGLNGGHRGRGQPPGEKTGRPCHAKPDPASPPRPLEPCPRWGRGALGERGRKRSWRLPQGCRFAEKPGPRTRSAAGPAGNGREMRPPTRAGTGTLRYTLPALASQKRAKGPSPAAPRLPPLQ